MRAVFEWVATVHTKLHSSPNKHVFGPPHNRISNSTPWGGRKWISALLLCQRVLPMCPVQSVTDLPVHSMWRTQPSEQLARTPDGMVGAGLEEESRACRHEIEKSLLLCHVSPWLWPKGQNRHGRRITPTRYLPSRMGVTRTPSPWQKRHLRRRGARQSSRHQRRPLDTANRRVLARPPS
jgi:hypothetical protein